MGLFESDYQRNVLTELERKMRGLEEMKEQVTNSKIAEVQTIVDFVKDAKLLKEAHLRNMQRRIEQIKHDMEHRKFVRENSSESVDGFTNPHEMAKKFSTMEQIQTEINEQKVHNTVQTNTISENRHIQSKQDVPQERSH